MVAEVRADSVERGYTGRDEELFAVGRVDGIVDGSLHVADERVTLQCVQIHLNKCHVVEGVAVRGLL